jgi:PAS domain S-box-containing protein
MDGSAHIISLLDREGRVLYVNQALAGVLGREPAGSVGRSLPECLGAEEGGGGAFDRMLAACLAGKTSESSESPELDGRHHSGERRTFVLTLSNRLDDPSLAGIVCLAEDVTARSRQQAQLLALDRIASVGLLASGLAHEINNPLAAIVTSLELASNRLSAAGRGGIPGPVHAAELAEDIRSAREATERVRLIVRDLQVFSRVEDDRRSVVNVESLLDTSVRMVAKEIRQRARLEKHYGKVPPVYANESRLGQVFLNLLIHATESLRDLPPREDPVIRLTTRADEHGRVLVEVADSGPGLTTELRERLFVPFAPRPGGGSAGLALTICQRIVHELGGEIIALPNPGGGTVFRLTLPTTGVAEAAVPAPGPARPVVLAPPRRRGRILVVDDEPIINSAISRTLTPEHEVVTTERAPEALALLRAGERFDVIFCDLMMPQMTGMELHRTLSAELPEQAGRMIFLTGGAFTVAARRFLENVPNVRVEKPFDTRLLRAIVNDRVT